VTRRATERQETEETLQKSVDIYRTLLKHVKDVPAGEMASGN
jgi:hypothetical protein